MKKILLTLVALFVVSSLAMAATAPDAGKKAIDVKKAPLINHMGGSVTASKDSAEGGAKLKECSSYQVVCGQDCCDSATQACHSSKCVNRDEYQKKADEANGGTAQPAK